MLEGGGNEYPNLEGEFPPNIHNCPHLACYKCNQNIKSINLCIFKRKPEKMENGNFRKKIEVHKIKELCLQTKVICCIPSLTFPGKSDESTMQNMI